MSAVTISTVNNVSPNADAMGTIKRDIVIITMTRYKLEFLIIFAPNKPKMLGYNAPNTILTAKKAHILRRPLIIVSNSLSTPYPIA